MKDSDHFATEHMDSLSPDVSIILVNWNTRALTLECIESVRKNTTGISYEIIVVDNASSDDSVAALKAIQGVQLILNSTNEGFAQANNRAMRIAKGRAWLLLNTDTIVLPDVIHTCYGLLLSDPLIGMVSCQLLNADRSLQRSCAKFPRVLTPLLGRNAIHSLLPRWKKKSPRFASAYSNAEHGNLMFPNYVMGAFMLVRPEAVADCGPLDERFFMYYEDMEWCYRFWNRGWRIAYTPEVAIIHLGGSSSRKVPELTVKRQVASILLFWEIHMPETRNLYLLSEFIGCIIEAAILRLFFFQRFLGSGERNYSPLLKIKILWAEILRLRQKDTVNRFVIPK
jgi:GT2 family glycosyltransferase